MFDSISHWPTHKISWVLILLWVCYVPEVKLDMQHTYIKTGYLKQAGSRNGAYHLFNGKAICESMSAIGCKSGFRRNYELAKIDNGETKVELVLAPNLGYSIGKSDIAIEIRKDGIAIPGYSFQEMKRHRNSFLTRYLLSLILFSIFSPVILFPQLLKTFSRS